MDYVEWFASVAFVLDSTHQSACALPSAFYPKSTAVYPMIDAVLNPENILAP